MFWLVSAAFFQVDDREIPVITYFDVQLSLTGSVVSLQPVNPSDDEQCTTFPCLDFQKCICNCTSFPRVGWVLVNEGNLNTYGDALSGRESDGEASDECSEEDLSEEKNENQESDSEAMYAEKINLKGANYHKDFQVALRQCNRQSGNSGKTDLRLEFEPINYKDENAIIVQAHLEGKWQPIGYIPGPKVPKLTRAMFSGTIQDLKLNRIVRTYVKDIGQNMFNGSIIVVKRGRWESDKELYTYNEHIFQL